MSPPPGASADLDTGDLRCLVALAEHRHFARAAAELHLSTSALSRRLARLERTVGVPLVERDSGGFHDLTAAGRDFTRSARAILARTRRALETARPQETATVRVGSPGLPPQSLTVLLAQLRTHLRTLPPGTPAVRLVGVPLEFGRMWDCLPARALDVLINCAPNPGPGVVSVALPPVRRVGVIGARHPLAGAGRVDVAEFAEHRLLIDPRLPAEWMRPWWLGDVRGRGEARVQPLAARGMADVYRALAGGRTAIVTQLAFGGSPGPWEVVELTGAPPAPTYAEHRTGDRRPAVAATIDAARALLRGQ